MIWDTPQKLGNRNFWRKNLEYFVSVSSEIPFLLKTPLEWLCTSPESGARFRRIGNWSPESGVDFGEIARIGSPISPKSIPRTGLCTYCVNKYWVVVGRGLSNRELIARIGSPISANRELIARIESRFRRNRRNRELIARIGIPRKTMESYLMNTPN